MVSFAITPGISLGLAVDRLAYGFSHAVQTCQVTDQDADVFVMSTAPVKTSSQADDDFSLAPLTYALKVCRRKGALADDQILNQVLKNLPHEHLLFLLCTFNKI